jgi:hydroxypyruvate reductase
VSHRVDWFDAGHPAPNEASAAAAERSLMLARECRSQDGVLLLLSGGASAMLAAPVAGVSLDDKVRTARSLMEAGAAIDELNCVRKHLSRIKGGRLAAAARRTLTLALSDVHGPIADDPSVIASGPTVPDATTYHDALHVIRSRRVTDPASVIAHLERGVRGEAEETIKPGDPRLRHSTYSVVGNRETAMNGARRAAEACGYRVIAIPEATRGEARQAGLAFVQAAIRMAAGSSAPVCVIGSGETTVTVTGPGRGGRNQEFALAAVRTIAGSSPGVVLASAGTDGIDGPTDAAGAIADTATSSRAAHAAADPEAALARNDAYHFFAPLGDLIQWGPTGTNVGDLHVFLIG